MVSRVRFVAPTQRKRPPAPAPTRYVKLAPTEVPRSSRVRKPASRSSGIGLIFGFTLDQNTVVEGAEPGTVIGTIDTTPPGGYITIIDDADGRISVTDDNVLVVGDTPIDYEETPVITIIVRGTSGDGDYEREIDIIVINVNELVDIDLDNLTILENSSSGTLVGGLESVPSGASFTLIDNAGGRFAISGSNLVAGSVATNYETATSHEVTVRATRGADTIERNFTIQVLNVNEITDISLSNNTIQENSSAGTVVGAISTTPSGAALSLTNTAGSRFAISGSNLVAGSVATDYESATSHSVTIQATIGEDVYSESFTIFVQDVSEGPVYTLTVNRNVGNTGATNNQATPPVTGSVQATASGGTGPYTYSWYRESGASQVVASSPNSQSTTFTLSGASKGNTYSAQFQCLATDSLGAQGIMGTTLAVNITWN